MIKFGDLGQFSRSQESKIDQIEMCVVGQGGGG